MKRVRLPSEGALYQRKDGLWCGELLVGHEDGKKIRRFVYAKKKPKALEKLQVLQLELLGGKLAEPKKMVLQDLLAHWLEDVAHPTIRDKTYQSYESIIDLHINPRLGSLLIQKLSVAHIQNLLSALERDGKSARIRQLVIVVMNQALKLALKYRWVRENICGEVTKPRATKRQMKVLNSEQIGCFLQEAAKERLFGLYVLAITTGLRFGELLALRWIDVDLKAGKISVQHTLQDLSGKLELKDTKTEKGRRSIKLTRRGLTVLREHQARMFSEGHRASPWVFCDTKGRALRQSNITRRSFLPLLERAKLPRIRFHDLRHSFATLMLAGGEHPKVVQEMLGHSKIALTLDTYSHVLEGMQESAVSRLDERLDIVLNKAANLG